MFKFKLLPNHRCFVHNFPSKCQLRKRKTLLGDRMCSSDTFESFHLAVTFLLLLLPFSKYRSQLLGPLFTYACIKRERQLIISHSSYFESIMHYHFAYNTLGKENRGTHAENLSFSGIKIISLCASNGKRMRFWTFTDAFESFRTFRRVVTCYNWASSDAVGSLLSADMFWL